MSTQQYTGRHAREQDPRDPEFCRCGLGLDAWVHTDSDRYVATTLTPEKWAELRGASPGNRETCQHGQLVGQCTECAKTTGRMRVTVGRLLLGDDHLPLDREHVDRLLSGEVIDTRPLEISPAGEAFVIRNGRHRFLAAVLTGRLELECVLREP